MATQVTNGKAYAYAVAIAMSKVSGCQILDGADSLHAEKCFSSLAPVLAEKFSSTAVAAAKVIAARESLSTNGSGSIRFQGDSAGQQGDVRDLVIQTQGRAIGISCKTNHADLKHARLSRRLNFVSSWGIHSAGCSAEYFQDIDAVFEMLQEQKVTSNGQALWSEIADVPKSVYWPVLDAWKNELIRALGQGDDHPKRCKDFVRYLFGNRDFYKVIGRHNAERVVSVQGFNFDGTLNTPKTQLPSRLVGIDRLNGGQYSLTVRMDKGFTFNFRIHSASSRVEPSLKFAVSAVSLPPESIFQTTFSL